MLFEIEFIMCFLELPKTKSDEIAIYNYWRGIDSIQYEQLLHYAQDSNLVLSSIYTLQ